MTRVWIAGMRIHHGPVGVLLALVGRLTRRRWLTAAGVFLALDDWRDFPWRP